MRRSLPLAVQTDSDSIEHYWLDEVSTLSPAVLQRVLREAGIAAERLKLTGVSLEDHTVESISGYNSGLLLESDAAENVWQRDLVLEVLAGPNTGFVSPLGQLDDLAAALHDEHICEESVLLHCAGRLVLASGRRRTDVELETPFVLGHSVVRISADTPQDVRTPASTPLKLAGALSVPNRNYRYYLALALGPLLIGAVLIVFTKMWFFLLFGILSLVGGLIP